MKCFNQVSHDYLFIYSAALCDTNTNPSFLKCSHCAIMYDMLML